MPQCGLAPGFIGILGASMMNRFDRLDALRMRVGALPEYPHNQLMYHLTWSTDGVINEYCKPCEVIHRGQRQEVLALDGLERFAIDGVEYEAFNTSGGLGTLCETLEGKVNELNYKTVRYPGHHYLMDFLINGLRMGDTLETQRQLGRIFDRAIPMTTSGCGAGTVRRVGLASGPLSEETNARKIYHQQVGRRALERHSVDDGRRCVRCGRPVPRTKSSAVKSGFVRQEDVALEVFLANRFGKYYAFDAEQRGAGGDSDLPFPDRRLSDRRRCAKFLREEIDAAIERARQAALQWRLVPAPKRGQLVGRIAEIVRRRKSELAAVITLETGKIPSEAEGEVQEWIDICEFAMGLSRQLYGLTIASERPNHRMMEQWHPLGTVGIITAFNFPMAVWAWNAMLALVCGDSVIWKPSEKGALCAQAAHAVLDEAGIPEGLSQLIQGGREAGMRLARIGAYSAGIRDRVGIDGEASRRSRRQKAGPLSSRTRRATMPR